MSGVITQKNMPVHKKCTKSFPDVSEKMEISEVLAFFGTPQNYQVCS